MYDNAQGIFPDAKSQSDKFYPKTHSLLCITKVLQSVAIKPVRIINNTNLPCEFIAII